MYNLNGFQYSIRIKKYGRCNTGSNCTRIHIPLTRQDFLYVSSQEIDPCACIDVVVNCETLIVTLFLHLFLLRQNLIGSLCIQRKIIPKISFLIIIKIKYGNSDTHKKICTSSCEWIMQEIPRSEYTFRSFINEKKPMSRVIK